MNTSFPIRSIILRWHVIEYLVGKGEFGTGYLVRERRDNQRHFALKEVSSPSSKEPSRIPVEVVLLQRHHRHTLRCVYQILQDVAFGRPYILMDFIEGTIPETLQADQSERRLSFPQAMACLMPVTQALLYLYRNTLLLTISMSNHLALSCQR